MVIMYSIIQVDRKVAPLAASRPRRDQDASYPSATRVPYLLTALSHRLFILTQRSYLASCQNTLHTVKLLLVLVIIRPFELNLHFHSFARTFLSPINVIQFCMILLIIIIRTIIIYIAYWLTQLQFFRHSMKNLVLYVHDIILSRVVLL